MNTFKDLPDEFDADNDYQCIMKIMTSLKQHELTNSDIDLLLADKKTNFLTVY